jgi:tetratricopeptide (TPR) repeat protein
MQLGWFGVGVVLALVMPGGVAWAREPDKTSDFDARFEAGVELLEAGTASGDRAEFERCAEVFVGLYNEFVNTDRPDELLFNGAFCSESAGMIGTAVQLRTALVERFPNSHLAQRTLFDLSNSYASIAYYERAAERYEQYAARYPNQNETPDALQNAYLFRVALGHTDTATKDLDAYEKLYEAKDPERAAKIFWTRRELLSTSAQRREHALAYLKKYGSQSRDRSIVAEAVIAQIDWRNSCTEPLLFDSCISIEREHAPVRTPGITDDDVERVARVRAGQAKSPRYRPPTRCGVPSQAIITVHPRKRQLAADAQARFEQILRAIRKLGRMTFPEEEVERRSTFADAWGMAIVYRADAGFEELLALELPDDLDVYVDEALRNSSELAEARRYKAQVKAADDSRRRLHQFLERKHALVRESVDRYSEAKGTGSPYWTIVAMMRVGMLYEDFYNQLSHAKVPRSVRTEPQVEAYCRTLASVADPILDEMALPAWEYCVQRSTEYQYFTEFTHACEARLVELDPLRYPATSELFGEPTPSPTRMRTVGVQAEER